MLLVSDTHRFIFIHIPKTAGTSVTACLSPYSVHAPANRLRRVLRKLGLRQSSAKAHFRGHDTARQVIASLGRDIFDSYLSFTVVRNPFTHAVSHYEFLREHPKQSFERTVGRMSFSDYLDFRLAPPLFPPTPIFARMRDQTEFLTDRRGMVVVRRILHLEQLAEEFGSLLCDLGLPLIDLGSERRRANRIDDVSSYYSSGVVIDKLRRIYARDFSNFGYRNSL